MLFTTSGTISDPQGRYVIVSGQLFNTPVVLVSVYAPNWHDVNFVKKIFSLLPDLNIYHLIFGGDLNCMLDTTMDHSNPKTVPLMKMSRTLAGCVTQIGCVDPWRFLFKIPDKTRILFFFTCSPDSIKNVEYSAIFESDHTPLILFVFHIIIQSGLFGG